MKQNDILCSITATLYPSYLEGLTSPASAELIEAHLQECPDCQKLLFPDAGFTVCPAGSADVSAARPADDSAAYMADVSAARPADNYAAYMAEASYLKHYRRLFWASILGVFSGILLFVLLLANASFGIRHLLNLAAKQHTVRTDSPDDYYQWEDYTGISEFAIFPEDLSGCKSVNEYHYRCGNSSILTTLQLYLDCQYSPEGYETEKQRLLKAARTDTDNAFFAQPACYTMLFSDTACEYAIFLEEEQRILYISLENISRDELVFDEIYLPLDYGNFGSPPENQAQPYCQYQGDNH